jgi:hypothetical protein
MSERTPSAPPTRRRLLVAAAAVGLAISALATLPTGVADATPEVQAPQCVEAVNRDHVEAGRATRRILTVRAVGSDDYLGSVFATTSLEQTSPGSWRRVTSCTGLPTTTTTTPGSTTSTTQLPGERPPLSQRYTAVYETDARLDGHTVYRPQNLAAVADPMPIVVWGNGACRADGTWFQEFLQPLAAHGVLVIASGEPGGSGSTTSDMLIDAIDFAVTENGRQGSQYRGRLDVNSITAMGQSCGGLEAIDASSDARVDSTILWNSGIFASGGIGGVGKDALTRLHGPVAWLNGSPSDIAYANALDDYQRVPGSVPSVFGAYGDVGHMGLFTDPDVEREIIGVAALWLDATLYDNDAARAQFVGADCGLCDGTEWEMQSKNWP